MSLLPEYWLNVDKPTKTVTIHHSGCRHELAKYETKFKGINALKRDGGWLQKATKAEVNKYSKGEFGNYKFKSCSHCL